MFSWFFVAALVGQAPPPPTFVVAGRVVDEKGAAVVGATLRLSFSHGDEAFFRPMGTSGPDGAFRFEVARWDLDKTYLGNSNARPWDSALLVATAPGRGLAVELLEPDRPGERALEMGPEQMVSGRIVRQDGRPVAGAEVRATHVTLPCEKAIGPAIAALLRGDDIVYHRFIVQLQRAQGESFGMGPMAPVLTDAEGRFSIGGLPKDRLLWLEASGAGLRTSGLTVVTREGLEDDLRARLVRPVPPQPLGPLQSVRPTRPAHDVIHGATFEFAVEEGSTISGRALDAETGAPVANVKVVPQANNGHYHPGTRTDAQGRYRLADLPPGRPHEVWVAPDQRTTWLPVLFLTKSPEVGSEARLDVRLPRGVEVTGTVRDAETGGPPPGGHGDCDSPRSPPKFGSIMYVPDATNDLMGAPELANWHRRASSFVALMGEGNYRLVVPPGAGALFVTAQVPDSLTSRGGSAESVGHHRRGRYAPFGESLGPEFGPERYVTPRPLELRASHLAVRLEVPKGAKSVRKDLALVPGKTARVRVVDSNGLPETGAIVAGTADGWDFEVALEGHEAEVIGLGGAGRPPRLVVARDATRSRAGNAWLTGEEHGPVTITLAKVASVRAKLVAAGPIGVPNASTLAWKAKGPQGGSALWQYETGPRLIDKVEVLPNGDLLATGAVPGLTYEWEWSVPGGTRPVNWPESFVPGPGERVDFGETQFGTIPARSPDGS